MGTKLRTLSGVGGNRAYKIEPVDAGRDSVDRQFLAVDHADPQYLGAGAYQYSGAAVSLSGQGEGQFEGCTGLHGDVRVEEQTGAGNVAEPCRMKFGRTVVSSAHLQR